MKIRLQLLIGFFILILVFVVVFFVNQRLSQAVLKNTTYLNNSENIIKNSNIIHKEMIEMQSGFRGFLLTQQKSFLQPYQEGLTNVPSLISEQRILLSSDHQKQKLDSIYMLHKEWLVYADSLIQARKDTLPGGELQYRRLFERKLKMEVGKNLNDEIRKMFFAFDNNEYKVRQARRAALQSSIKNTRSISLILLIASVFIGLLLSYYFIRTITRRISKLVNLSVKISEGNFITIIDTQNDEFTKLVNSLNQTSQTLDKSFEELSRKNKELDQFAYVVSHDLKAPLRGIANIIEWIEEDHLHELTPEVRQNLMLIKGRTERLEKMINGLLDYARIGKGKKEFKEVDVETMVKELKELIIPANVALIIENKLPVIKAEKVLMEQLFANLLSNAVKYNKNIQPEIRVSYGDTGKFHKFQVSDNGTGIESKYFEKIFEMFQTLQERDAFESTGVGLAIVKKILEDNNGHIEVVSTPGNGSTFTFFWPKIK